MVRSVISYQSGQYRAEKPKKRRLVLWHDAALCLTIDDFKTAQKFVLKCLELIPCHIQKNMLNEYVKRFQSTTAENPARAANIYLRQSTKRIQNIIKKLPFDDKTALYRDEILAHEARKAASYCMQIINDMQDKTGSYEEKLSATFDACNIFVKPRGVAFMADYPSKFDVMESALVRYVSDEWWAGKFERVKNQTIEYINIAQGLVNKGRQEYASNQTVSRYRKQRAANEQYLAMMDVINEDTNERTSLKEIADKTTANPELRRIELMVRCKGLEELAAELGHDAFFVTWTAPSKYHKNSNKWNGARPDETQKYLCEQWAKCRAKIKRAKIQWFGIRVAEAHADGTPHWHMLVFTSRAESGAMQRIMSHYAMQQDRDESGAVKHRFTVEKIDPAKGSATGYIAKYIAKNINAQNVENLPDYDGSGSLQDAALRVGAWASTWCVRQFQFFGCAKVSIWRECRRLKSAVECAGLEAVRLAADGSKWAEFTKLLQANPVRVLYQDDDHNKYGERVNKICGLKSLLSNVDIFTRLVSFRLEKRAALSAGKCATWSPVNNCTVLGDSLTVLMKAAGIGLDFLNLLLTGARIVDRGRGFRLCNGQLIEFKV